MEQQESKSMNMNPYYQTLWAVWGNHILTVVFLTLNFEWWLLAFMFVNLHIFAFFSEASIHRYYTHRAYTVASRFKEHVLKLFAFLTGQGAILSWVTVHRHHHAHEDKPGDPHSPYFFPWWKIYLGLFPKEGYQKNLIMDLIRHRDRKYFIFENKYYWLLWTATWIVSYAIHPLFFFFIVSGSAMWYFATSVVNILAHKHLVGYKKYPEAVANNSLFLQLLTSIGNHNNHHKRPRSYTYALDKSEKDWIGLLIEKVFADTLAVPRGAKNE